MGMTKVTHYCDHCGKEIDYLNDYTNLSIEMNHVSIGTDLCVDCFRELEEMIKDFCTQGERKGNG